MSIKSFIAPHVASFITSRKRFLARRRQIEHQRQKAGAPHLVEFFHDPSDPYSQLLKSIIPQVTDGYEIELETHLVGPPDDEAAPERSALEAFAFKDAQLLATRAGMDFDFAIASADSISTGNAVGSLKAGNQRREALGHYLGGMLYYGGEWYWGLDRLHYLEDRLEALGAKKADKKTKALIFTSPLPPEGRGETGGATLHWYLSLRSPYTAIVADRVKALAAAYGAEIKLRFVLPMVMRALPVPKNKRQYIIDDTVREAHRLGVPFGRVCDPVGRPVERAYSILPWAIDEARGFEFVSSFLRLVWSEGVDAGGDRGLRRIVTEAGLDWAQARQCIGSEDWRAIAEANRRDMMERGIWGVPSFRVNEVITWGQDRLWVIEDELKRLARDGKPRV